MEDSGPKVGSLVRIRNSSNEPVRIERTTKKINDQDTDGWLVGDSTFIEVKDEYEPEILSETIGYTRDPYERYEFPKHDTHEGVYYLFGDFARVTADEGGIVTLEHGDTGRLENMNQGELGRTYHILPSPPSSMDIDTGSMLTPKKVQNDFWTMIVNAREGSPRPSGNPPAANLDPNLLKPPPSAPGYGQRKSS